MKPRRRIDPYLMLLPTLVTIALFFVYPLISAVKDSFYDWDLLTAPRAVGARNYVHLARSGTLVDTTLRTLSFAGIVVVFSVLLGLAFATLLHRPGRVYAFVRGAIFSAYIVSWVSVALLWMWILDSSSGVLTITLKALGLPTMNWLGDPKSALVCLAFVTVWKIAGYSMVIFQTGLEGIPRDLYEAAALDGAGPLRRFLHVTWPSLRPTTLFVATTSLILSFQAFDVVRVMTQGGPVKSTSLFVYAIYEEVFVNFRVGRASALVVVFFLVLAIVALLNAWAFRVQGRERKLEEKGA